MHTITWLSDFSYNCRKPADDPISCTAEYQRWTRWQWQSHLVVVVVAVNHVSVCARSDIALTLLEPAQSHVLVDLENDRQHQQHREQLGPADGRRTARRRTAHVGGLVRRQHAAVSSLRLHSPRTCTTRCRCPGQISSSFSRRLLVCAVPPATARTWQCLRRSADAPLAAAQSQGPTPPISAADLARAQVSLMTVIRRDVSLRVTKYSSTRRNVGFRRQTWTKAVICRPPSVDLKQIHAQEINTHGFAFAESESVNAEKFSGSLQQGKMRFVFIFQSYYNATT